MTAVLIGLSVERPEVKTYQLFGPRKSFLLQDISQSAQRSDRVDSEGQNSPLSMDLRLAAVGPFRSARDKEELLITFGP
jgi:hypothetical protein